MYVSLVPISLHLLLIVIDCGSPQEYPNADVQFTTTLYQSMATYKCRAGYELASTETPSLTIECQADGTWTGLTPMCNRK